MPVTATQSSAQSAAQTDSGNALAKLSGDYTMFLKLLTSQMTNQDPLNPMDTSQYTQQLVQYSQVEQSIQQSGTLKEILARLSNQDMIQASSLIGRTVSYSGATAAVSAHAPAQWEFSSARPPASLSATITDASGKDVDVRALDPKATSFAWDGTLANGARAPDGAYTLRLTARDTSGIEIATTVNGTGKVDAVSLTNNVLALSINGQKHDASAMIHVR